MKILILDFKNAGWFHRDVSKYDEKDFVFDLDGKVSRRDLKKQYVEPINPNHISNVLHVLFGERPSASLRRTYIKEIPEIKNIALKGWIKLDDYFIINKNGKKIFFSETIKTKKSVSDSWDNNNCLLHWKRIEMFLGEEMFAQLLTLTKELFNNQNITHTKLEDVLKKIHYNYLQDARTTEFLNILKKNDKTPLYNTIKNGKFKNTDFNKNPKTFLTTNGGVNEIVRLRGKIIIPLEDEKWLEKLKNSPGIATILDGGLVTINSIINDYEFYEDQLIGFRKINEISTELIKH